MSKGAIKRIEQTMESQELPSIVADTDLRAVLDLLERARAHVKAHAAITFSEKNEAVAKQWLADYKRLKGDE